MALRAEPRQRYVKRGGEEMGKRALVSYVPMQTFLFLFVLGKAQQFENRWCALLTLQHPPRRSARVVIVWAEWAGWVVWVAFQL